MNGNSKQEPDGLKYVFDWCTNICTLSSGAIVIIVAFYEKLSSYPNWKLSLAVSLVAFIAAIVGAASMQFEHLMYASGGSRYPKLKYLSSLTTLVSFPVGMFALVVFALANFAIASN